MSDPSQPSAPPPQDLATQDLATQGRATQDGVREPANAAWRARDGLRGFLNGKQSLALAFWVLGVGVAVLITVAGLVIDDALPREAFLQVLLATTLATILTRILAWYAIIKCRRNTSSEVFSALALTAVALDIVMGAFRWPALLFALSMI